MVWVGRDFLRSSCLIPLPGQRHLSSGQVTQSSIQPDLERVQGETLDGPSTTSLGQLFQCLTSLIVKKLFLISNLNLLSSA